MTASGPFQPVTKPQEPRGNSLSKFACPCCGYLVFDERDCYEICPICFWEDDGIQIADPWFSGGANKPSLEESQRNFAEFGAMEKRFISNVRAVTEDDTQDPDWRPVQLNDKMYVTTPREIGEQHRFGVIVPYEYWKRSPSS